METNPIGDWKQQYSIVEGLIIMDDIVPTRTCRNNFYWQTNKVRNELDIPLCFFRQILKRGNTRYGSIPSL